MFSQLYFLLRPGGNIFTPFWPYHFTNISQRLAPVKLLNFAFTEKSTLIRLSSKRAGTLETEKGNDGRTILKIKLKPPKPKSSGPLSFDYGETSDS